MKRLTKFGVLLWAALAAAGAVSVTAQGQPAPAGPATETRSFPLGPRDQLRLRVGQWEPTQGVYMPWPDFGGDYLVGSDGTLSLPMIGTIMAAGRSPEEVAGEISVELYTKAGLVEPPTVSIEVTEYRPIYVIGAARQPGAFPFVPGLTVLKAVGLAGGVDSGEGWHPDQQRNAVSALGEYEVLRMDLWRYLAQSARVEAELAGSETIEMPQRLEESPVAATLLELQYEIKSANDSAMESSLAQIRSLEELLNRQIVQLDARIALRDEQVNLARKDLASVDQLLDKGLSVASRQILAARTVADLESGRLELETARLQAEQQLNEARRDQLDLVNDRRRDLLRLLEETRAQVTSIEKRMETAKSLFATASRSERLENMTSVGKPVFTITRRTADGYESISAEGITELLPDDVLEIEVPLLDGLLASARARRATGSAANAPGNN